MFDKIKSLFFQSPNASSNFEQAVIIGVCFESGLEFGTKDEQEKVYEIEDQLRKELGSRAEVDGHDFGDSMYTLYIYGESADALWSQVKDILDSIPTISQADVTLQYGQPQDLDTKEKKFTYC